MIDLRRSGRPINDGDSFSVQIVGSRAHADCGGEGREDGRARRGGTCAICFPSREEHSLIPPSINLLSDSGTKLRAVPWDRCLNEAGSKVEADVAMCPPLSLFCREENRDGDTYES